MGFSGGAGMLVGISQRVLQTEGRNERRDALDQAWVPFLAACGFDLVPIPNGHADPVAYLRRLGVAALILSGGGNISMTFQTRDGRAPAMPPELPDLAPERDVVEGRLLRESLDSRWPVIGVCRGMEIMNVFHGGRLEPLPGHAGTRHSLWIPSDGGPAGLFDEHVNSFHDLGVPRDGLGDGLRAVAVSDGYVEAFVHDRYPHAGIMWHPERTCPWSPNDIAFFKRFLLFGRLQ